MFEWHAIIWYSNYCATDFIPYGVEKYGTQIVPRKPFRINTLAVLRQDALGCIFERLDYLEHRPDFAPVSPLFATCECVHKAILRRFCVLAR